MQLKNKSPHRRWPWHGWLGLILIIVFWMLNWLLAGLRTHWGFFPLWLGYCLTVDAIVYLRKGNSLISRSLTAYLALFVISAPSWWLFELINKYTHYWYYDGRQFFSDMEYFVLATISFSTVIPAVFGTAELVSTFNWINFKSGPRINKTNLMALFILGWIMLIMIFLWPENGAIFMWVSIYFIIEPINVWIARPSLIKYTAEKNWNPVLNLWLGCLICGFFWEMWNYYSYPKWIYQVPHVDFWYIFEMPLLGYLGYLPFALELFALYHLLVPLFKLDKMKDYVQIE